MVLFFVYLQLGILLISLICLIILVTQLKDNFTKNDLRSVLVELIKIESGEDNLWELITEPDEPELLVINKRITKQLIIPPHLLHSHELSIHWEFLQKHQANNLVAKLITFPNLLIQITIILLIIEFFTELITFDISLYLFVTLFISQFFLIIIRLNSFFSSLNKYISVYNQADLGKMKALIFSESFMVGKYLLQVPLGLIRFLRI